jgi:uncharacterized membrane protein YdcZ (DUF606 family)
MEFVFLFISILVGSSACILIVLLVYGNWKHTKRAIKRYFNEDDGILGVLFVFICIMLVMIIFVTLCACNNTFWHLDYLTT